MLIDKFQRACFCRIFLSWVMTKKGKWSLEIQPFTDFHRKSTPHQAFCEFRKDWLKIFGDTGRCHLRSPTPPRCWNISPALPPPIFPSISPFSLLGAPCVSFLYSPKSLCCGEKSVFLKPTSENSKHMHTLVRQVPFGVQAAHPTLEGSPHYRQ